jgi:tetratricopeptide (TPR) repeat protein
LEDFNEVIKIQMNNSHAYFGRAFAHKALRDYDKAAEDFDKAKQINPLNPKLIVNFKQVYNVRYIKLCNPGEEMR